MHKSFLVRKLPEDMLSLLKLYYRPFSLHRTCNPTKIPEFIQNGLTIIFASFTDPLAFTLCPSFLVLRTTTMVVEANRSL